MKRSLGIAGGVCLTALLYSTQASAQDAAQQPTLNPAEIFTCNYNKGKGRSDLDKVVKQWNSWADKTDSAPYNAWLLTPVFFGPEITFDVAWLGAWPTYEDMGINLQNWQQKGAKVSQEFDKVISCDSHGSMASMPMQELGKDTGSALVRFMDCKVDGGSDMEASIVAHRKFGAFMDTKGSKTEAWMFFPGMGAGDIDYDYKLVLANASYPSLALDSDIISNKGGWMEAAKTFGGNTTCDSPRLYQADTIRSSSPR